MNKQEIFDLCSQERLKYVFVESWVKIVDDSGLRIEDVEWVITKLDPYNDLDLIDEIKQIEISGMDLQDGYYLLKCLFSIRWDYDDYRSWPYLEPEIFEFDFKISLDEVKKQQEEFDELDTNLDLFSDPSKSSENYIGLIREEFSRQDEWKIGYRLNSDKADKMKEWKDEMLSCGNIEDCKIFRIEEIK
jgi:hypothetical protein